MKRITKSEWFIMEKPIGEPDSAFTGDEYQIQRVVDKDGVIIWFGCDINWKKEVDGNWTELTTIPDTKPLEEYLPEIVYGSDRTYWKECEMPIYEKMYIEIE